jgi:hypothetical protein
VKDPGWVSYQYVRVGRVDEREIVNFPSDLREYASVNQSQSGPIARSFAPIVPKGGGGLREDAAVNTADGKR